MEVDLPRVMREDPDAVANADSIYHVTIEPVGSWTIDTTVPNGRVYVGLRGRSDCDIKLSEDTFQRLMDDSLSARSAYSQDLLRLSNVRTAVKLARIVSALQRQ